jgi:hypothetical protein
VLLALLLLPELPELLFLPFPFPFSLLLPLLSLLGVGTGGVGPPEDTTVPTVVAAGVAANAEDVLLLMAGS